MSRNIDVIALQNLGNHPIFIYKDQGKDIIPFRYADWFFVLAGFLSGGRTVPCIIGLASFRHVYRNCLRAVKAAARRGHIRGGRLLQLNQEPFFRFVPIYAELIAGNGADADAFPWL